MKRWQYILVLGLVLVAVGVLMFLAARPPRTASSVSPAAPQTATGQGQVKVVGDENMMLEGGVATSEHYMLMTSPTASKNPSAATGSQP